MVQLVTLAFNIYLAFLCKHSWTKTRIHTWNSFFQSLKYSLKPSGYTSIAPEGGTYLLGNLSKEVRKLDYRKIDRADQVDSISLQKSLMCFL